MLSFWEQDVLLPADLLVVGGGLIGLQTALELRARRPKDRIVLLERGLFPSGASTKNAGFACFGSLTEILSDLHRMGEAAALDVVERRWRGLHLLRQRVGDAAMDFEGFGGFELIFDDHLKALDELDRVNDLLAPLFGTTVFELDATGLAHSGFGKRVRALVRTSLEGQVHSGKLLRALALKAGAAGIELLTGAEVVGLESRGGAVDVRVKAPGEPIVFRASRVAVCTNGLTRLLLPQTGVLPGRGQVLITEPIPGLPWRGTYHAEEGYFYFRNVGDRVLLGGGRHLDFHAEASTDMALTAKIQGALEAFLRDVVLPDRPHRVAHRWAGIMGFTADKRPVVERLSPGVTFGFGCNGMGVALGSEIAERTAELMLD